MSNWNPDLYLRFADERTQPAWDLAQRVELLAKRQFGEKNDLSIADLGCGPGNSTAVISAMWSQASILGIDSSADMISAALKTEVRADWEVADLATWKPGRSFEVLFSNAVFQWIPDQVLLLKNLWTWLSPKGVLAFQVPGNIHSPLHQAVLGLAQSFDWIEFFETVNHGLTYKEPDFYYETLSALGAEVQAWETTYWHVLPNHRALIDWYRSTGLRPWLMNLPDEQHRKKFEEALLDQVRKLYQIRSDGSVFFPFRRIFCTAVKSN